MGTSFFFVSGFVPTSDGRINFFNFHNNSIFNVDPTFSPNLWFAKICINIWESTCQTQDNQDYFRFRRAPKVCKYYFELVTTGKFFNCFTLPQHQIHPLYSPPVHSPILCKLFRLSGDCVEICRRPVCLSILQRRDSDFVISTGEVDFPVIRGFDVGKNFWI